MLHTYWEDLSPTLIEIAKIEREEGREEGKKDALQYFAKKLLITNNMSVKEIAELTELTVDEVEKLKKEL